MKDELRKAMLQKRQAHHQEKGHINCLAILDSFIRLPEFNSSRCILLYAAKGSEVHTDGIIKSALSLGKKVAMPLTIKGERRLELYEIKSEGELSLGAFGILEPPALPERRVDPSQVDLAVVPGVSFDLRGHRLGYGKGYYDSLLPRIKGVKVGLAYCVQLAERIPNEPHDVPVDILVTEEKAIRCSRPFRIAVLASGRGSDFQSIMDATKPGGILYKKAEIAALITDNPQAQAIARAKDAGIPVHAIPCSSREELDSGIHKTLDSLSPDLAVLAGYMRIIRDSALLSAYRGRMINIHPSLLPKYPGAHAQRDAFLAGEKISGYTIHFVDASLDGGPIIYQEKVDISSCKSADEAAARILEREHIGLPLAISLLAEGRVELQEGHVSIKGANL